MADASAPPQPQGLPVVLVHRIPIFDLGFAKRIHNHFTLLDPHLHPSESSHSFLSRHASSIRALLTVGPTPVTSEMLSLLPELRVIVGSSAGLDHIDLQECRRRGILVANCGNAAAEDGADYAIALLIDVLRGVSAGDRFIRAGLWPKHPTYPLGSKVSTHSFMVTTCNFTWN